MKITRLFHPYFKSTTFRVIATQFLMLLFLTISIGYTIFASQQLYIGQPIDISTNTEEDSNPDVAYSSSGDFFVVVWDRYGSPHNVFAKNVSSDGSQSYEYVISNGTWNESEPKIAYDPSGNTFLVVWLDSRSGTTVYGLILDSTGTPSGSAFKIPSSTNECRKADVGSCNGKFLVVWDENNPADPAYYEIKGRLISTSGSLLGTELTIADIGTSLIRENPSVTKNSDSKWLVVFEEDANAATTNIEGRFINSNGTYRTGIFTIANDAVDERNPAAAGFSNNYFVAYDYYTDVSNIDLKGQIFNSYGSASSSVFFIANTSEDEHGACIAYSGSKNLGYSVSYSDYASAMLDNIAWVKYTTTGAMYSKKYFIYTTDYETDGAFTYNTKTKNLLCVYRNSSVGSGNIYGVRADGGGEEALIDYGSTYGLYRYDDYEHSQLHTLSPIFTVSADVNEDGYDELYINFGFPYGLWEYDYEIYTQISKVSPEFIKVSNLDTNSFDDELIIDYGPGYGLYVYNDGIHKNINPISPEDAVPVYYGTYDRDWIAIDYGPSYGLYQYDDVSESHTKIHPLSPKFMLAGNITGSSAGELITDFNSPYGIWYYGWGLWWQINTVTSESIISINMDNSNSVYELAIDYGPSYGLYLYTDGTHSKLNSISPENMIATFLNSSYYETLVIDYGSLGIWECDKLGNHTRINTANPEDMLGINLNRYPSGDILVDYGSAYGLWIYNKYTGHTQINPISPESMTKVMNLY